MASEHVTVIETVSIMGAVPQVVDTRFYLFLPDDPQPYSRQLKLQASEEWTPLDLGWVDNPGLIIVKHDVHRDQSSSVVTTNRSDPNSPEVLRLHSASGMVVSVSQQELAQAREQSLKLAQQAERQHLCVLEVGVSIVVDASSPDSSTIVVPFAQVLPGQSLRIVPIEGTAYYLRLREGTGRESIYVFPRKPEKGGPSR